MFLLTVKHSKGQDLIDMPWGKVCCLADSWRDGSMLVWFRYVTLCLVSEPMIVFGHGWVGPCGHVTLFWSVTYGWICMVNVLMYFVLASYLVIYFFYQTCDCIWICEWVGPYVFAMYHMWTEFYWILTGLQSLCYMFVIGYIAWAFVFQNGLGPLIFFDTTVNGLIKLGWNSV